MKIFKYELPGYETEKLVLPQGSKVLSAGEQDGILCVWVQLNEQGPPMEFTFYIYHTGYDMRLLKLNTAFVNTVQMRSGLVYHVFYKTEGY